MESARLRRDLNHTQELQLRSLCTWPRGEAPRTEVDGRIIRALERRKFVARVRDAVVVTGAGRAYHDSFLGDLAIPADNGVRERDPRKAALAALSTLARHIPANAEIDLSRQGDGTGILAYGDDIVRALRRYVERSL